MRPEDMVKGKKYEVRHRTKGVQRYDRKSVMVYLGIGENLKEYVFSARPVAGTQNMSFDNVISIREVHQRTPIYLNARA